MSGPGPRVLHVLTLDLARGAQRYAVALQEGLRGQGDHRILTLFPPQDSALGEHVALDHPPTPLRRLGFDPWLAWRLRKRVLALDPALVVAHGSTPLKYLPRPPSISRSSTTRSASPTRASSIPCASICIARP